jgi:dTDP-4-amino-4,6-dideoxygalactose transaminase
VTCANATVGLEMAYTLKMLQGFRKIELPALTFPATWLAANRSGLEIVPIDVDPDTWVAAGVSGFGVPTYGPVVDAAGAFGEQSVPIVRQGMTAVFSLHATKPLGCGEGGYIVTWSDWEAEQLRQMSNFGIVDGRSVGPGTNAKMSEYHAAMALAALDAWDREPWLQLYDWYDRLLPSCVVKQKRPRGVYSLLPVKTRAPAQEVTDRLAAAGIETRRWYCPPMHKHPMFEKPGNRKERRARPVNLPVTDDLAEHLLGLPYHLHLTEADVAQVCEELERACSTRH